MTEAQLRDAYLQLMAETLTGINCIFESYDAGGNISELMDRRTKRQHLRTLKSIKRLDERLSFLGERRRVDLALSTRIDKKRRHEGRDWAADALTMVGMKRLQSLKELYESIQNDNISGDFVETGVWRGGASIFLKSCLFASGDNQRDVVLCDSFQGMPVPGMSGFNEDVFDFSGVEFLAVTVNEVKENFARFGLLDDHIVFVEGWFHETLPKLSKREYSLMRLDGDLYSSTMIALQHLYPSLSKGGFVVVDDYGDIAECQAATDTYRELHGITSPLRQVDQSCVWWRK